MVDKVEKGYVDYEGLRRLLGHVGFNVIERYVKKGLAMLEDEVPELYTLKSPDVNGYTEEKGGE